MQVVFMNFSKIAILCKIPPVGTRLHRGSLDIRTMQCKFVLVVVRLFVALHTTTILTTLPKSTSLHRTPILCTLCKRISYLLNYIEGISMYQFLGVMCNE